MREVAYRRLLARLFAARPDGWVVKGGVALLLRLDPNRTSNDIAITYIDEGGEHGVALEALREDAALDLEDFFAFEVGAPEQVVDDHPAERTVAVPVIAYLGVKEWARFSVDLGLPRPAVPAEVLTEQTTLTGVRRRGRVPGAKTLALADQIADKACALFERHGAEGRPSSRARDLADLAMIAGQVDGLRADEVMTALAVEVERRSKAGALAGRLPHGLELSEEQEAEWRSRWKRATRDAPVAFAEARELAAAFLDPILDGSAAGRVWSSVERGWI
jgi:hypothetical protein